METKVFQLKVNLRHTRPPIWRRLEVQSDMTLGELHHVIQSAMGWTDSHLHNFVAKGIRYGAVEQGFDFDLEEEDERDTRLDQVLTKPKDKLVYEYDFGDSWVHDIVLEKVLPIDSEGTRYPLVTGGRRACPPEDIGGVFGYGHMLEVLSQPDHPEYEEMLTWVGGEFDPERFDVEEVNRRLGGGRSPAKRRR